jgi:hypothetical protein
MSLSALLSLMSYILCIKITPKEKNVSALALVSGTILSLLPLCGNLICFVQMCDFLCHVSAVRLNSSQVGINIVWPATNIYPFVS